MGTRSVCEGIAGCLAFSLQVDFPADMWTGAWRQRVLGVGGREGAGYGQRSLQQR